MVFKKVIGWFMMFALFGGIFFSIVIDYSLMMAIGVYASTAALVCFVIVSVTLISSDN